jgi:hypothetical protein
MQPQDQQKISLLLQQYSNLKNEMRSNWLSWSISIMVGVYPLLHYL